MKKLNQNPAIFDRGEKEFFWVLDPVSPTTFLNRSQKSKEIYDTHVEGKKMNSNVKPFLTQMLNRKKYSHRKSTSLKANPKQEVVSITYEEIGLFPRSFSRVLDVRPVPL